MDIELDFGKQDGLITAIVQDDTTNRVLMVGYMNQEAFQMTVETGFTTFWSRSRSKLWMKGESSGHRLLVKSIAKDCDQDAVLVRVEAQGPGVCHAGYESCFYRELQNGAWVEQDQPTYNPETVYGGIV